MVNSDIHIEYVIDTNTTLYQAYKDSTLLYVHFQESYQRLLKATSYAQWVKDLEADLTTADGDSLLSAIERLVALNGSYPQPVQKLDRTFPNGDIGTGDFFKKPVNVYIYRAEDRPIATDTGFVKISSLKAPKDTFTTFLTKTTKDTFKTSLSETIKDTIKVTRAFDITQVMSVSKNYGKLWKSTISGYAPPNNDGGYYYLVIMRSKEVILMTPGEYREIFKL